MVSALICTHEDLEKDLAGTPLWRADVERFLASRLEEARTLAVAARPRIIVVDAALPWAGRLVAGLREDAATRAASIVVLARGDFDPAEVELLESGANAIVRLPAGEDAERRLLRLLDVPGRREARFPVAFQVEALTPGSARTERGLALNLSVNGLLMEASVALHVGDELDLAFRVAEGEEAVNVRGRVMRLAGGDRYGIEFSALPAKTASRLRHYLDGLGTH